VLVLPRSLRALLHATWGHADLLFSTSSVAHDVPVACAPQTRACGLNARHERVSGVRQPTANEGDEMYIGGGVLALILIIILIENIIVRYIYPNVF